MGLFDEIKRIIKEDDDPKELPTANVDILGDINSLIADINKHKLLLINPELYRQFDEELKKIKEQWLNNEQAANKSISVQRKVIDSSVKLKFKFDDYMKNTGNNLLTELYIKEIYEDCEKIITETKNNPLKVLELLSSIDELQKSLSGFDFLINNNRIIEKLNQTRYEVIKISYYLNRNNKGYILNEDSVMLFSKYIIFDAFTFLENTKKTKEYRKEKEDLELAIIFGSFEDPKNLLNIFDLLQRLSKEAFTKQLEEKKPEIDLRLLPTISTDQIKEYNEKIISITNQVLELQLYDNEYYQRYLDELSQYKVILFTESNNSKILEKIDKLIFDINAHIQGYGQDKEQMKLVGLTIKRINSTKTDADLDRIVEEIENDSVLSKILIIKETIDRVRLERTLIGYENMKKNKDLTNIMFYKSSIINNATEIVNNAKINENGYNKKVFTEMDRLLKEEINDYVLKQLFVLIVFVETTEIDYQNYYQSFIDFRDSVVKMVIKDTDYHFEEVRANEFNSIVKINKDDETDRMNCAAHILNLTGEKNNMPEALFNTSIIKTFSDYYLNLLVGSHQDQVIGLLNGLAKSVVENGLIPVFMINLALSNGINIDQTREHIRNKLLELKNNPSIYSTLMNDDLFYKVKYIVDDYTKTNSETQAESMLLDLIPGLNNVDITFLSLKILFSYYHDLKFYDEMYKAYFSQKTKRNPQLKK